MFDQAEYDDLLSRKTELLGRIQALQEVRDFHRLNSPLANPPSDWEEAAKVMAAAYLAMGDFITTAMVEQMDETQLVLDQLNSLMDQM